MRPGQRHENDVYVENETWIHWVDIPAGEGSAVEVDAMLQPITWLFDALETHCVTECCGVDALDFSRRAVTEATRVRGRYATHLEILAIRNAVASAPGGAEMVSTRLNQHMHREMLCALLDHLADVLLAHVDDREALGAEVRAAIERALGLLPGVVAAPEQELTLLRAYLEHSEFESALETLERIGQTMRAGGAFWGAMADAARTMERDVEAQRFDRNASRE